MNRADRPRYRLEGFTTPDTSRGYDTENEADTLKEARAKARHMVSLEWQRLTEASGPLSYVRAVDTRSEAVAFERYREADPALAAIARTLHNRAVGPGLYADPGIDGAARFDGARVALGYPHDRIELRDAYACTDDPRWVKLSPSDRLFNQRGERIANPLADPEAEAADRAQQKSTAAQERAASRRAGD